jgi:glycosyltransferase involved in cell wall biosynthesis
MEHLGHARLDFRLDGTARRDSLGPSAVQREFIPLKRDPHPLRLLFAESSTRGYGTEQHIAALATAMARRGHDVRCLASAGSPVERVLREAGVSTISVHPGHSRGLRMGLSLLGMAWRQRPEWLISNDPRFYRMFMGLRRCFGARTALFRHWHDAPRKMSSRELLARQTDRFILVSEFQREDYRRQGMEVERASILYNPIETERFRRSPEARGSARLRFGMADSEIVVGYVGRIVRDKGVFTLFEASERFLASAPEARMLWVGDGEWMTELRSGIDASSQRARHVLSPWEPDMSTIYPALDLLVAPSLYPEPFGRVSVEAQAAGVPVVCSTAGGLPETLLSGVTGFLVPPADSVALADAVLRLVRDRDLRREMGNAGASWVKSRFGLDTIARSFETLLAD